MGSGGEATDSEGGAHSAVPAAGRAGVPAPASATKQPAPCARFPVSLPSPAGCHAPESSQVAAPAVAGVSLPSLTYVRTTPYEGWPWFGRYTCRLGEQVDGLKVGVAGGGQECGAHSWGQQEAPHRKAAALAQPGRGDAAGSRGHSPLGCSRRAPLRPAAARGSQAAVNNTRSKQPSGKAATCARLDLVGAPPRVGGGVGLARGAAVREQVAERAACGVGGSGEQTWEH